MAEQTLATKPLITKSFGLVLNISIGWLVAITVAGVGADFLATYEPTATNLTSRLLPPIGFGGDLTHPLGTDHLGRDILSRLMHATRISLLIALVGTLVGALIGTTLGFVAAYFRGWVDDLVMVLVDFQAAMPFLIFAIGIVAFLGGSMSTLLILVAIFGWERFARLARGLALSALQDGYAEAAFGYGARPFWVFLHHILPNVASVLLVNMSLNFPETVLLESTLSFLGLGIQPPIASLGSMLSYGRDYLINAWWISVFAGILIFLTTLAMSLLGDGLRDHLAGRQLTRGHSKPNDQ